MIAGTAGALPVGDIVEVEVRADENRLAIAPIGLLAAPLGTWLRAD